MKSFKNLIIPILLIIAISAGIMINNQTQVEIALNTENLIKKDLKVKKVESTSIWLSNYKVSFENYEKLAYFIILKYFSGEIFIFYKKLLTLFLHYEHHALLDCYQKAQQSYVQICTHLP